MNKQDLDAWIASIMEALHDPVYLWLSVGGLALLLFILALLVAKRSKAPSPKQDKTQERIREKGETAQEAIPREEVPAEVEEIRSLDQSSWLSRLRQGLSKTRSSLHQSLEAIFSKQGPLDHETLELVHETLFRSDIGVATADKLVDHLKTSLKGQDHKSWSEVQSLIRSKSLDLIGSPKPALDWPAQGPLVILIVGVNGVGKTTTIGKLAAQFLAQNKSVLLCAADTFRAAAIDQLKVWGERLGVKVIAHQQGSDPAAVAYDAVKAAMSRQYDVLLIDTAGRLHSKSDLMAELNKINRVIGKDLPEAPHETWLVVDATTGQNAFQQVAAFKEVVALSGLIVTKLDGTAKGGVIIGISDQFKLPICYIGVGEKASDLRPFVPQEYVDGLFS